MKVLYPVLFSCSVVPVYIISHKILRRRTLCFFATFFYISQPAFFTTYQLPIRQEVALIFFASGLVVLGLQFSNHAAKWPLFILLNIGMILSHYATAYLALGLYVVYLVIWAIAVRGYTARELGGQQRVIGPGSVVMLVVVTFFWYSQVNTGLGGFASYISASFRSIPSLLSNQSQMSGQSPTDQLNPFSRSDSTAVMRRYIAEVVRIQGQSCHGLLTR